MGALSASSRAEKLARLAQERWDLLVVGGGITGAGICREAARRGWRVLLIDQRDFAWGTSSRSSKLVHGGLRYLKDGQLGLTFHSVRERQRLMREAPDLIEAQSFLLADCVGRKPHPWLFRLGLMVYDAMSGQRTHGYCDREATLALAPGLAPARMRGATIYRDAKTDDARLVNRVLAQAELDGALALNYVAARAPLVEVGRVCGMTIEELETGRHIDVRASAVVNATGAWADQLRGMVGAKRMLRPLRGSHLIVPFWRLPVAQSISLMHPHDGRPVFFYPWEGVTLIGTTDLDHRHPLDDEAAITPDEVAYLLAAVNDQYPGLEVGPPDVIACYAGVRPVLDDGSGDPSRAARDHLAVIESGLITVCGGKLTTFRTMAQDALALAAPLVGKPFSHDHASVFTPAAETDPRLPPSVRHRLAARYGPAAAQIAALARPDEFETVPGTDTLWLELRVAALFEAVVHLDDLLLRRTRLGILLPRGGLDHQARVRGQCQVALGWDDAKWQAEVDRYQSIVDRYYRLPPLEQIPDWHGFLQNAKH